MSTDRHGCKLRLDWCFRITSVYNQGVSDSVQYFCLSRVLRPPGGGSNISLGADEEKPPVRKNKMASSVFAEPEDPYANRRNNPPGTIYPIPKYLGMPVCCTVVYPLCSKH